MPTFRYTGSKLNASALRGLNRAGRRDLDKRSRRVEVAANRLVGVDTGLLKSTIRREFGDDYVDIIAGRQGRTSYTLFHHDGTAPHVIRVKNRKAMRWYVDGQPRFAKSVHHPGSRGTYFLTRALPFAR